MKIEMKNSPIFKNVNLEGSKGGKFIEKLQLNINKNNTPFVSKDSLNLNNSDSVKNLGDQMPKISSNSNPFIITHVKPNISIISTEKKVYRNKQMNNLSQNKNIESVNEVLDGEEKVGSAEEKIKEFSNFINNNLSVLDEVK